MRTKKVKQTLDTVMKDLPPIGEVYPHWVLVFGRRHYLRMAYLVEDEQLPEWKERANDS